MSKAPTVQTSDGHRFQVQLNTFFGGWTPFGYDEEDRPVTFSSVEQAMKDLQAFFDMLLEAVREGDREADQSYDPNDFAIRCVTTADLCGVTLRDGRVLLSPAYGTVVTDRSELSRINASGRFGQH